MDKLTYEKLTEIQGRMEAEMIESFLEAHEIDVELIQESIGRNLHDSCGNGLCEFMIVRSKKYSFFKTDKTFINSSNTF